MGAIDRELKRGTLEMMLLKLLAKGPMYGYQLVSTLEAQLGPEFQIKEGTLYPVLYRLEDGGFLETRWETVERGAPRKYYQLTDAGARQLQVLVGEWKAFVTRVNALLEKEDEQE
ncbi:MAG: PadR family transcriptional regulator [Chloroflexi bacterium]|nr:PadR family transcriptional regulator [Chloroflexota bacterium]